MNDVDYSVLFEKAFQRIKSIRDPRPPRKEEYDLEWYKVRDERLLSFGGIRFDQYTSVIRGADDISYEVIECIISRLLMEKKKKLKRVSVDCFCDDPFLRTIRFMYVDSSTSRLLIFKELEQSPFWITDTPCQEIQDILTKEHAKEFWYVYFVNDYAYVQFIGYRDDAARGHGVNAYSFKDFFATYFGKAEYDTFIAHLKSYKEKVENYIGYSLVRTLNPNAHSNFRILVQRNIYKYQYESLKSIKDGTYAISDEDYDRLAEQFFNQKAACLLLGNSIFAESFITAEWLYDSMSKAKAIDLSIIAMGYYKAVEQLLFSIICLHKKDGRLISSAADKTSLIPLDDKNINDCKVDSTLGSMAHFVKNNMDIMRKDLKDDCKSFVREFLFAFSRERNKPFHKDNIHTMGIIDKTREVSYYILFLLLSAFEFSKQDLITLGFRQKYSSEYNTLCEYINYHRGELFYVDDGKKERLYISRSDPKIRFDGNTANYSGLYFSDYETKQERRFTETELPKTIISAKLKINPSREVSFDIVKDLTVYENRTFIGPKLIEEKEFDY